MQNLIQLTHLTPKPILISDSNRKFQFRWSYAFSISSLHSIVGFSPLFLHLHIHLAIRTTSIICLPLIKVIRWPFTNLFTNFLSLSIKILYTLPIIIGLKSFYSLASIFLGINTTKVTLKLSSNIPWTKNCSYHIRVYHLPVLRSRCFIPFTCLTLSQIS